MIWEKLIKTTDEIVKILNMYGTEYSEPGMERFNNDTWTNRTWKTKECRRAHVDIVDARKQKGLWMAHICLFPNLNNDGPIYGFDVIAGKNKITGAFHDFSPLLKKDHELTEWFVNETEWYRPTKPRELPDWAKKIFSKGMIAAGNINTEKELNKVCGLATYNLVQYLEKIGKYAGRSKEEDVIEAQNYYCEHQQQNPHTPRVMLSLGLPEPDVKLFCTDNLFPKIQITA